ncbi:hypothetical protein CSV75_04350 [Sporosarcina sp. P18a]|uniref:hypothetical protein n=1 Tax=Sporosarcina sp. P18a TaxID=2048259 RepID=UPI000C165DD9|nr:hypothetical protein [Sporosarcina sp. P18a]PIC81016.1 hypothetical protein CSV75_04350 [Sporosarcina sp. P18a]
MAAENLIAGTMERGFFGVVDGNDFFTSSQISGAVGVTAGAVNYPNPKWLKFALNGKIIYKSMLPVRTGLSWDYLVGKKCVYGNLGDATAIKDGIEYKVRLMKGSTANPSPSVGDRGTIGSEWNKLMLPIHERALDGSWKYPQYVDSSLPVWRHTLGTGKQGMFSDKDLQTIYTAGNGSRQICQETVDPHPAYRVSRGYEGVEYAGFEGSNANNAPMGWYPVLEVANEDPTLTLLTTENRTLYENDTYAVSGSATDTDSGNVVMIKYRINGGTTRTISTQISTGAAVPFNRVLIFKGGMLYDGATAVTGNLAEGTQHVLSVWVEDDQGGKSAEQTRTFYVVPNRPPKLTVDPITPKTDMIDSDSFEIKGTVNNPDANGVKVHYKIGNSAFNEVYISGGAGGEYSFRVNLSQLIIGANSLTVRATDHFGAVDTKTITITKTGNVIPLKTAVTRYKLTPPNGTSKGVLLWIERETGDLVVDAEISMTAAGEPENFQSMTKSATAFVSDGIEEDEFTFDVPEDKSNIILKITQTRTSTASEKGITLITGVFA